MFFGPAPYNAHNQRRRIRRTKLQIGGFHAFEELVDVFLNNAAFRLLHRDLCQCNGAEFAAEVLQNTRIEMEITANVNYSHVCVEWRRLHLSPLCKPRVYHCLSYSRWPKRVSNCRVLYCLSTPKSCQWQRRLGHLSCCPWARPCKSSNNTNGVMAPRPALNRMAEFGPVGFDHHYHHRVVKRLPCEASWSSSTSHSHSS